MPDGTKNKKKKNANNAAKSPLPKPRVESPSVTNKGPVPHEWRDGESEVRVTLLTGPLGAAAARVSFSCSPNSVRVDLPGGQKWSSQLFATVLPDGSDWQHKGGKILLRLLKLDPKIKWPSLQPVKSPRPKKTQSTKEMKDKSNVEKSKASAKPASPAPLVSESVKLGTEERPVEAGNGAEKIPEKVNSGLTAAENASSTEPVLLNSEKDAGTTGDGLCLTPLVLDNIKHEAMVMENRTSSEPIELDSVKHGMYETDSVVRVSMYVKQVKRETLAVSFDTGSFSIDFSSSDGRFLASHGCQDDSCLFRWTVRLAGEIRPVDCSHSLTNSAVELSLAKTASVRWNALHQAVLTPSPTVSPAEPESGVSSSSRHTPLPRLDSAALPDPSAGGDRGNTASKYERPPSPLPLALPAPPPPVPAERGFTGLENIGNTCFLNSVIQCLANTAELKDYFADSVFQSDINRENPLGMNGQLALSFAVLLRVLWSGQHRSHNPHQLKTLVAKKATQFTGFAQHDAQEFMAFLLDGLHEDLNRVRVKPYTATVEAGERADAEVAREAWRRYKLRNNSMIVDLFQGQYKSKLVCPCCSKVSVTFDPFLYLSIPLPKKKRPVAITFFRADPAVRPVTYQLYVTADGNADEIMEELSGKTGVSPKFIKVIEERKHKVLKVFPRGMGVSSIGRTSHMLAFELLDPADVGEPVVELVVIQRLLYPSMPQQCAGCRKEPALGAKLRRCTRCYRIGYCDLACQREHWPTHRQLCSLLTPEPVGCPFVISLPRSKATYSRLCATMEAFSRYSVNVFCVPVTTANERRDSGSSSVSSDSGKCTDSEEPEKECEPSEEAAGCREPRETAADSEDKQLFFIKPVNAQGASITSAEGARLQDNGDTPLELQDTCSVAMDWKTHQRCRPYCLVENRQLEPEPDPAPSPEPGQQFTLHQCLQLFTQPEQLSPGEAWYCPSCKTHREAEKQMSLWRTPLNLIVQLKRFSFKDIIYRDKIDKMVTFPIRGLDLSPYLTSTPEDGPAVYDLYAVINHHGGILGGHYTAYARCVDPLNPERSLHDWRLFDDSRVSCVPEQRVMTSEAYLLFYRRRTPFPGASDSAAQPTAASAAAAGDVLCTDAEEID